MIRTVKICAILLMVAAILAYGGLVVVSLMAKPATASGILETNAHTTAVGTATPCPGRDR